MPEELFTCRHCGTCCVAPDISSLNKSVGVRCPHLDDDLHCRIYGRRPAVCRGYKPDGLCRLVDAPELEQRVERYLGLFGMGSSGGE